MHTLIDSRLALEATRFRLRYTCADCAHFDASGRLCAEGYPNEEHLEDRIAPAASARASALASVTFCKSFELA